MALFDVRPACACGARFYPITVGESATVVARRTCRRCASHWTLTVRPTMTMGGSHLAHVDGTCLKGATKAEALAGARAAVERQSCVHCEPTGEG